VAAEAVATLLATLIRGFDAGLAVLSVPGLI